MIEALLFKISNSENSDVIFETLSFFASFLGGIDPILKDAGEMLVDALSASISKKNKSSEKGTDVLFSLFVLAALFSTKSHSPSNHVLDRLV